MGQVTVTIRGRHYQISCDDGQERHIAGLGRYLDQQAEQVAATAKNTVSDALLLVMVGLLVADELNDANAAAAQKTETTNAAKTKSERDLASALNALAERIEEVAARVEGP